MKEKKHNKTWFLGKIGQLIYCTDHKENEKCEGIKLEGDWQINHFIERQRKGIYFY